MAENEISDYDETDNNNVDIAGISVAENVMRPPAVNDAFRALQGALKRWFKSSLFRLRDSTDQTKLLAFDLSDITTATTRTLTVPDKNGTIAMEADIIATAKGYLYGLTLSNNASDATNDIDIAAGGAVDSTGSVSMFLAAALGKRLDAAWAVGGTPAAPNGGLDTGSIANTTYHVFLIRRPDTGVVDALFSASATTPTLPANYTQFRRIGSIIRSSGAIRLFDQYGDFFQLKVPVVDVATSLGTSAVLYALTVPQGIKVTPNLNVSVYNVAAVYVLISSPDQTDSVPSSGLFTHLNGIAGYYGSGFALPVSNTSSQIRARSAAASTSIFVTTTGWTDTRGRAA